MGERLKSFFEKNKELIKENKWCELYKTADNEGGSATLDLANFLFDGLGQETMLDLFVEEGKIPDFAFEGCSGLESITIPDNMTVIGRGAFRACSNLKEITIGDGVTAISHHAFFNCSNLENITLGGSVTFIGTSALEGCKSLLSITIPKSVTFIGDWAFCDCKCHIIFECDKSIVTKDALKGFEGTYEFK